MRPALRALRAEHLALKGVARVLKMEALIIERGDRADLMVLRDIAAYLAEMPIKYHHPKEELFAQPPQHEAEHGMVAELWAAVAAPADSGCLAVVTRRYAEFLEEHIHLEDHKLLPLAETALSPEAWAVLDTAMAEHLDPLVAGGKRFTALHDRIMDVGLPPFALRQG